MSAVSSLAARGIAPVDGLGSISLTDLNEAAALQERVDRKYVLSPRQLSAMVAGLTNRLAVLEIDGLRSFEYESVYFDTSDLDSYLGAARRRRRRFKVRTRSYLDSGTAMLEVKTRGAHGKTIKQRRDHDVQLRHHLGDDGRAFVAAATGRPELADALRPTLTSHYRRTTLVDLDDVSRVTFDVGLRCSDRIGAEVGLADAIVVETKSAGAASATDAWLWRNGVRPEKISKYGTGLAALHPELPSNKWHRTLQRHFV
ncbi:MAG: polyphosphate polymerase domain-containing protein [Ilumatobacter sp.]